MPARNWFALFLLTLIMFSRVVSAGNWTGYINDKSLKGERYGYLSSVSSTQPLSKFRLLCHSDSVVTLYIDEKIVDGRYSTINLRVDQLPVVNLAVSAIDGRVELSNQSVGFWMVIAQMAAGVTLSIDAGSELHQYSLEGFTQSYNNQCGWSGEARKYRNYLHHYR